MSIFPFLSVSIYLYDAVSSWLYSSHFAVDANFKLKQKNHGYKDLELSPGYAYFVAPDTYTEFAKDFKSEVEVRTALSSFDHHSLYTERVCIRSRHATLISPLSTMQIPRAPLDFLSMGWVLLSVLDIRSFNRTESEIWSEANGKFVWPVHRHLHQVC